MRLLFYLVLFCSFFCSSSWAKETLPTQLKKLEQIPQASLLLIGENQIAIRPDQPLIPASTLKLLTALLALETWGGEHRFITDFDLDENNILWIKGYGDPFITSEEMDLIVIALKKKGLKKLAGIGVDQSYFEPQIKIDGQSESNNPYDASLSPLAVNFNTINIKRSNGKTYSAESQTPLTAIAKSLGDDLPNGKQRINLGEQALGPRYFAELLAAKLSAQNIEIVPKLFYGKMPNTIRPYYRHSNSHNLAEVISAMLQYSNNFIANQLFLLIGVETEGAPANMEKSRVSAKQKIEKLFAWNNYVIVEGSGLSRKNRLSARQLVEILQKLAPHRKLLAMQNERILAKSGTLTGISTYAGYLHKDQTWQPFALMINQTVDYNFRKHLAEQLLQR